MVYVGSIMKLLLVDGHYYAYRSFFAIRNLSNSRGEPTNAIYGFLKTVRRMVKDLQPDLGAVCWDEGLPERRTELQPEYKQQRPEMPSDLAAQLDAIQKMVPLLGFHNVIQPNTEADDLMAKYSLQAREKGFQTILATNDKDLFQLVDDQVAVYSTAKADLESPRDSHALLGPDAVRKKWGVDPAHIGEILALTGDSVDNIAGVPGVGPKTATRLIQQFGSVDELLRNVDQVESDKLRNNLREAADQIQANREMVRLDLDLTPPVPLEDLQIRPDYPGLLQFVEGCEFKSMHKEISEEASRGNWEQPSLPL